MAHLAQQAVGDILDNYSDVIEGGTGWRGSGTSWRGVPGTFPNDDGLRYGSESPLTTDGAGDTTTLVYTSGTWAEDRWVKEDTPGFFAMATAGAAGSTDAARRITGWSLGDTEFTTDAFPVTPGSGATIAIFQGFKRMPNGIDIEADETGSHTGFDRFFSLSLLPAGRLGFYGNNTETIEGVLSVRLRILKYGREHDARASVLENLTIISSALTKSANPDHRDGTYTRALFPPASLPDIETNDDVKIIGTLNFPIIYRINRTFE